MPQAKALAFHQNPDIMLHEGHEHDARGVDSCGQRDERQTPKGAIPPSVMAAAATADSRGVAGGAVGPMRRCRRCGRADGPCRAARYRVRNRLKRCYELAGAGLCQDGAEGFMLVHGVVTNPRVGRLPYDHAWLLDPATDSVYDPVLDRCFTQAEYQELMSARAQCIYTYADFCKIAATHQNFGPWPL
jgi:hypothetical protein